MKTWEGLDFQANPNAQTGGTAARANRLAKGKSDSRSKLIGAIRAAAHRKGMSDEHRRDLIERVTGKRSAGDCSLPELGRVLDEMNRDWRTRNSGEHRSHIGKVKALWWTLFWLAEVEDDSDRAITAFVRRQTGISSLRFLDHRSANSVIEALKAWVARAGVVPVDPAKVSEIAAHTPSYSQALHERHMVLDALWARLDQFGVTRAVTYINYLQQALGLTANHHLWGRHELDAAIRHLGNWLHRVIHHNAAGPTP